MPTTFTVGADAYVDGQALRMVTGDKFRDPLSAVTFQHVLGTIYEIVLSHMDADGDALCWSIGGSMAPQFVQDFPFLSMPIVLRKCDTVRALEPRALQWRVGQSGDGYIIDSPYYNHWCVAPEAPGGVIANGPTLQFKPTVQRQRRTN